MNTAGIKVILSQLHANVLDTAGYSLYPLEREETGFISFAYWVIQI